MNTTSDITKEKRPAQDEGQGPLFLMGKPLIIEFVGPTGSGKTTNCLHFSDVFRKQNLNVYGFSDVKQYLLQRTFFQQFNLFIRTLLSTSRNIFFYATLLASNGIYSIDSLYRYIKLCIFNTGLRQFMSTRKVDVLFLDQWVIQGLWSATIFKANSYEKLQKQLNRFYFPCTYVLYFDIDEETASERIGLRLGGRSRFDKMEHDKRLAELRKYNQYLYQLYENSDCKNKMKFSTRVSPGQNAEDFYVHLKTLMTKEIQSL